MIEKAKAGDRVVCLVNIGGKQFTKGKIYVCRKNFSTKETLWPTGGIYVEEDDLGATNGAEANLFRLVDENEFGKLIKLEE